MHRESVYQGRRNKPQATDSRILERTDNLMKWLLGGKHTDIDFNAMVQFWLIARKWMNINPLTPSAAESSRAILSKSLDESRAWKTFDAEILIRTLPTTLLQLFVKFFLFLSYHQKYHRCRRQYL